MMELEYLYRDAGNFKVFGSAILKGVLALDEIDEIRQRFSRNELFIAEQLGISPLYEKLYQWSGGRNSNDHCWHEFVSLTEFTKKELTGEMYEWGTARDFFELLSSVVTWRENLSPHFC